MNLYVAPVQAGVSRGERAIENRDTPAFAGVTGVVGATQMAGAR